MENRNNQVGALGGMVTWILGVGLRFRDAVWLLGWRTNFATVDRRGNDTDGSEHGSEPVGAGDRGNDSGPSGGHRRSLLSRIETPDALLGLSIVGLIVYSAIWKMDATTAVMLTSLFGVVVGRATKRNGKL